MRNLERIAAWLGDRVEQPGFGDFLADRLLALCAVDTVACADLPGLGEREEACYALIRDAIREHGPAGRFEEHHFSPGLALHPAWTFPYYAGTADAYRGRYNLLFHLSNGGTGRPIAVDAHIDTVAPFFPPRRAGATVFGRGACDDKGNCLAMVAALRLLREVEERFGLRPDRDVLFAFVTDEETGGNGSLSVAVDRALKPGYDSVIVMECCGNRIHPANRGALWYRLEIPPEVPEPIRLALEVIRELEREGRALKAESGHPLFPDRPVQTNHGILGPYGEFPSRICGFVEVELLGGGPRPPLERLLEEGLGRYVSAYGDKTRHPDPRTGRPRVERHYELTSLPRPDRPGHLLRVWGSAGHMGSILENDNALTKLAFLLEEVPSGPQGFRLSFPPRADGPMAAGPLVMEGGQGFLPTHGIEEVRERLTAAADRASRRHPRRAAGITAKMSFDKLHNDAYDGRTDGALLRSALAAAELAGLEVERPVRGWNVSCDARLFAREYPGMEVLTMGPGRVEFAHSDAEQVELLDIGRNAAALALLLLGREEP